MTNDAIETALGQRLVTMPNLPPVAWPNASFDPSNLGTPYLEFVHSPVQRVDNTVDASDPRQEGLLLITVVTERGKFTGQANSIAEAVASRFSVGLRLALSSGGDVMVRSPPDIVQGFTDGAYWRVPVRIDYQTVS